jgi:hypothetical protein
MTPYELRGLRSAELQLLRIGRDTGEIVPSLRNYLSRRIFSTLLYIVIIHITITWGSQRMTFNYDARMTTNTMYAFYLIPLMYNREY